MKGWTRSGVGVALLVFSSSLRTAAPGLTFQDSGELIAAGSSLGLSHPPGSPLWCVLGKALSLLPLGHVPFRFNLLSCLFAGLSALCLGWMGARMAKVLGASSGLQNVALVGSALVFAWAPDPWLKSNLSEVYMPSAGLLLAAMILAESRRGLVLAWALTGANVAVHQSSALLVPWLLWRTWQAWKASLWPKVAMAGLLGGSVHLYLPLRSAANPFMDWGDPEGIRGFLWSMLRSQWGGPEFRRISLQGMGDALKFLAPWHEFAGIIGVILAIGWGLWRLADRRRFPAFFVIAFLYGLYMAVTLVGTVGGFAVRHLSPSLGEFYIPWYAALSLGLVPWLRGGWGGRKSGLALLALPVLLYVSSFCWCLKRGHERAMDLSIRLLRSAPRQALSLTCSDDVTFGLWYLTEVEERDPGALVVDRRGLLGWRGYAQQIMSRHADIRFQTYPYAQVTAQRKGAEIVPVTLRPVAWELGGDEERMLKRLLPRPGLAIVKNQDVDPISPEGLRRYGESWESLWGPLSQDLSFALDPNGASALMWFAGGPASYFRERGEWEAAEAFFSRLVRLVPRHAEFWAELGFSQLKCGKLTAALRSCQEALRLDSSCPRARQTLGMLPGRARGE